jgi:outer membrane protein OmpA-like peptidoglycan-associated protein
MSKTFKKKGDYTVQIGLLGEKDSLGIIPKICVMKRIKVYDAFQEFTLKGEGVENELNEKTDSMAKQIKSLPIKIYFMDDLTERQKVKIKLALNESGKLAVKFNQYGIMPASYPFLDRVVRVLKENSDIRLEVVLHKTENGIPGNTLELSEKWAQELAFYYKNKEIAADAFHCKGMGLSQSIFNPSELYGKAIDGVIELEFMQK